MAHPEKDPSEGRKRKQRLDKEDKEGGKRRNGWEKKKPPSANKPRRRYFFSFPSPLVGGPDLGGVENGAEVDPDYDSESRLDSIRT